MSTFNTKQGDNFGSLRRIRLVPVTAVTIIAIDANDAMSLTKTGAEAPMDIDFTLGTARFAEEDAQGIHGPSYKQHIEFFIPGDNQDLLLKINAQENRRFFVECDYFDEDTAGDPHARWAGNIDKNERGVFLGMVLKKDFDGKQKVAELKGHHFLLACESRHRAYWFKELISA
jgi:hypothetical protein